MIVKYKTNFGVIKLDEKNALRCLTDLKETLDKYGIPFWLEAGTLLGAIRENRFMPWDGDIDLGLLEKYMHGEPLRKKITKELEKKGFSVWFLKERLNLDRDKISINIQLISIDQKHEAVERRLGEVNSVTYFLIKAHRLLTVSCYEKISFNMSNGWRYLVKKNLFNLASLVPKFIKNGLYIFLESILLPYSKRSFFSVKVPEEYFLELKTIHFYGLKFKAPKFPEKYLGKKYGDWKNPPKDSKKWIWQENGEWIKEKAPKSRLYWDEGY